MIFYFDEVDREIRIISIVQTYNLLEEIGQQRYNEMSKQQRVDTITGQKDTPILVYDKPEIKST